MDELTSGSRWTHANGNKYTVITLANEHTERPDEYPVTVVYQGENGKLWAKPLDNFRAKMRKAPEDFIDWEPGQPLCQPPIIGPVEVKLADGSTRRTIAEAEAWWRLAAEPQTIVGYRPIYWSGRSA